MGLYILPHWGWGFCFFFFFYFFLTSAVWMVGGGKVRETHLPLLQASGGRDAAESLVLRGDHTQIGNGGV